MKYAIYDYSQAELVKFNDTHPDTSLDMFDLMILDWFVNFSAIPQKNGKKSMWRQVYDGNVFYNVRYSAIIEEFPFLNIKSVKTISRKFEKYVSAGLLRKRIYTGRGLGSYTFFAFTEEFLKLKYNDSDDSQKINPHKQESLFLNNDDDEINTDKDNPSDDFTQFREDKTVQSKSLEKTELSSLNQENEIGEDKVVQSKPLERTELSAPYVYPSIKVNSTTTTQSNILSVNNNKAVAEFYTTLRKLFGYDVDFSPDPYGVFVQYATETGITPDSYTDYLAWVYQYLFVRCKTKDSFDGYFFKSFTQKALMYKFLNCSHKNETEPAAVPSCISCPVCKTKHVYNTDCPCCGITDGERHNQETLDLKIRIWQLPEETRIQFLNDYQTFKTKWQDWEFKIFKNPPKYQERKEEELVLLRKYNLVS